PGAHDRPAAGAGAQGGRASAVGPVPGERVDAAPRARRCPCAGPRRVPLRPVLAAWLSPRHARPDGPHPPAGAGRPAWRRGRGVVSALLGVATLLAAASLVAANALLLAGRLRVTGTAVLLPALAVLVSAQ